MKGERATHLFALFTPIYAPFARSFAKETKLLWLGFFYLYQIFFVGGFEPQNYNATACEASEHSSGARVHPLPPKETKL